MQQQAGSDVLPTQSRGPPRMLIAACASIAPCWSGRAPQSRSEAAGWSRERALSRIATQYATECRIWVRSAVSHDVRGESALPPAPERWRLRSEATLRATLRTSHVLRRPRTQPYRRHGTVSMGSSGKMKMRRGRMIAAEWMQRGSRTGMALTIIAQIGSGFRIV
jgi:hypothetical protein